ncbi:MAG TPA: hypothetical protein VJB38_01625 [Bacteroidota bacterium]|nr:hypothetical protein [Bacteroidota bacterium]
MNISSENLDEAFSDIITGKEVTRSKHELVMNGKPVVDQFLKALQRHGFEKTIVGKVEVNVGERVPAFFIEEPIAYFGWVFWEKFTSDKARKLWGSVVKNVKGDWAIQISPAKSSPIYANPSLKIEMDADNPVTL